MANDAEVTQETHVLLPEHVPPDDLVTDILRRLPVVSLLRFKSVLKSWYALITSQKFIRDHLLRNNNRNIVLSQLKRGRYALHFSGMQILDYETLQIRNTLTNVQNSEVIFVVGSCHGLICLRDVFASIAIIWNPLTRFSKLIRNSNLPRNPADYFYSIEGIGFGFDAKINDYKIMNIVYLKLGSETVVQCEVCSLTTDSWRRVDIPKCFISSHVKDMRTCTNGMDSSVAYCMAYGDDWEGVLSFDMTNEVFLKTELPDGVIWNRTNNQLFVLNGSELELFELNESIAMVGITWDEQYTQKSYDIWLLGEVGVRRSWTRLFTIGPTTEAQIERPLGFWKNHTVFFESNRQLILYDPSTQETTEIINLQFYDWDLDKASLQLVTYTESLVSI